MERTVRPKPVDRGVRRSDCAIAARWRLRASWQAQSLRYAWALRQNILNHPTINIRQPEVPPRVPERQLRVVEPHDVQNGRMEIVHVARVLDDRRTPLIRRAVGRSALDAGAGQQARESAMPVIAAGGRNVVLPPRSSTELGVDDDERVVEEAALLEIDEESFPIDPLRIAWAPLENRRDDEEKTGTSYFFAARKIASVSASEPAIGLSIKTGLPAWKTSSTCSRWGRPSLVSSSTTSHCFTTAATESTTVTPSSLICSVYFGIRLVLDSISALPRGQATTTRYPASSGAGSSALSRRAKAMLWDVSSPIIPTRWDFSWAGSAESSNRLVMVKVRMQ